VTDPSMPATGDDPAAADPLAPAGGGDPIAPGAFDPANPATPAPVMTPTPTMIVEGEGGDAFVQEGEEVLIVEGADTPPPPEDQLVDGAVCNSAEVAFEKVTPSVMLLMDRSTSMFASNLANGGSPSPYGPYSDRWEALRDAVSLLEPYSAEVQFGAATFTGYSPSNGGVCPELQGLDIDVTFGNFDQILALLPESAVAIPPSKSETPTAEGIEAALTVLNAVETEGPKYLVLVTDGLPELCDPELLDKGVWCGHDPAFGVVQNAYMNGITTFVIGILGEGNDSNENAAGAYFLNGMAHAGQGFPIQAPTDNLHCIQQESTIARGAMPENDFYENWRPWAAATYAEDGVPFTGALYFAPSDDNLGPQLAAVVEATRSCSFEMDDNVIRAQADKGAVQFELADGTTQDLAYADANGWVLDAANDYTVVIQGTACTAIQSDAVANVKIQFPCETRVPRVR
jgi:hypothetical protein